VDLAGKVAEDQLEVARKDRIKGMGGLGKPEQTRENTVMSRKRLLAESNEPLGWVRENESRIVIRLMEFVRGRAFVGRERPVEKSVQASLAWPVWIGGLEIGKDARSVIENGR
jgi:hypothetical protein